MSDFNATSLAGQYYSPSKNELINLASVTRLWHQKDGIFFTTDRLYYASCGKGHYVDKSPSEIAGLFNQLADDGSFIQIGNNLLNTKSIQSAHYDRKHLYYQIAGDEKREKFSLEQAESILANLEQQKRFQRIGGYVVNMNKVVNMCFAEGGWLSNDHLKINLLGKANFSIDMPKPEAEFAQNEALKRPQFKAIGGQTVNIAVAGKVWVKGDTLHIKYPGTDCQIIMGAGADAATEHFSARGGYVSVEGEKVNSKITSKVWHTEGGFLSNPRFIFNVLSDEMGIITEPAKSKSIISQLEMNGDYVAIGEKLININSIGHARYDGKRLGFTQGTDNYSERMDEAEAAKVLGTILAHEKFAEIGGQAVNVQFASKFCFDNDKLECAMGQDTHKFEISASEAQTILGKIKQLGLEKKHQLDEIRHSHQDGESDEAAWDPDLLAEIYEEIDTMHTTNTVILVAVILPMINNSNNP